MRNRVKLEDKAMPSISSVTNADHTDMYKMPSRFTCRHDLVASMIH